MTELRRVCKENIRLFSEIINLSGGKVLDVGIAGDPPPGENFPVFGGKNIYETIDVDGRYNPTYVADLCGTDFPDNNYDLVIVSNVLEHVWNYKAALAETYRITKTWAIVDCPFTYPYHAEDDFGDWWRFTYAALKRLCEEAGFEVVNVRAHQLMTSVLCKKQ